MPAFLVLTSPAAGNTEDEALEPALELLRAAGDVEVIATASSEELDAALDQRADRTVVVAGGDGSLHAVLNALHRRGELAEGAIGLLPLGTGNDFARGLDLPLDPRDAATVVVSGTARRLDLLVDDDDCVVVNSVHAGVGAEAARNGEGWKERFGRIGYAMGAARAVVAPPSLRLQVEVDGQIVRTHHRILQVAIGNGRYVGGGAPLTPDARPDDGVADVLVAPRRNLAGRLLYAGGLVLGRHHRNPDVTVVRGQRIRVAGEEFWCSEDGEVTGPHTQREWRLLPSAYSMIAGR